MFALFYNLYYAMFIGEWSNYSFSEITQEIGPAMNNLAKLLTSIFGDFQVTDFGNYVSTTSWLSLVAFVLALITSIGIVVMAVKGVKKAFGIFFMGIR